MKARILLILAALCLSGCATYELSKAWRGGSNVPPPPLPKPQVVPLNPSSP